ncbi:MAG TPA: MFS transporter, partial [Anaerolineales bacterium]
GFFSALASVVAGFFGGTIVDHLGFKRTSITADLASAIAFGLIPLLHATIGLQFWELLILVFIGNLLDAPGTTARDALIPELAEFAGMSLERASAGIQSVERGSRLLGAPLAGVLIAFIGTNNVLWLDAISFLVSAAIIFRAVPLMQDLKKTGASLPYVEEIKTGFRFILQEKLILAIVGIVLVTNFLDAPLGGVIYPVYAKQFFGNAVDLGLIIGLSGGGALVGAILFAAFGQHFSRRAVFFIGFAIVALHMGALALVPSLPIVLTVQFISGLGAGPLNPIISTIEYERVPIELRGRVFGAITAGAYIAIPLGVLFGGYVLEWFDIRLVLAVIGVLYLLTIIIGSMTPATRTMDTKPDNVETGKGK